jgi:hypothetical protein
MSVEERWETEDEPVSQVVETPAKPPRRHPKLPLLLTALLILVLTCLYLAGVTAESASTPTATPTPPPRLLEETIDREARALAAGDLGGFIEIQDNDDAAWLETQQEAFEAWGTPTAHARLYQVPYAGVLSGGRAWADVHQFRQTGYFRETRFYRLRAGDWLRTRPDLSFWGKDRSLDTVHFHVVYAEGDWGLARSVATRFERVYSLLCLDLGCPASAREHRDDVVGYTPFPPVLAITLSLRPDLDRATWKAIDQGQWVTITLPSPRTMGLYDSDQADPALSGIAYDSLTAPVARIASGGSARWANRNDGELFMNAIVAWEQGRRQPEPSYAEQVSSCARDLADSDAIPLASLWSWPIQFPPTNIMLARMRCEVASVVMFIEVRYGPGNVVRLLNAFEQSESIQAAVSTGMGLDYGEFELEWRLWLETLLPH